MDIFDPLFLAIYSKNADIEQLFKKAAESLEILLGRKETLYFEQSISKNFGLLSCKAKFDHFKKRRIFTSAHNHIVTPYYIPSLYKCISEANQIEELIRMQECPNKLMELPPPATIVSHQKTRRKLTLTNDFAGTAKVYCCINSDISIFTNRPETVSMVLSETAQISRKAWMQQASFDWIVNDETYWNGIHMLPPGQSVHMTSSGYSVSETHGFSNLLAVSSDQTLAKTAYAIVGSMENALLMAEGNISTIGLSGGRDSRAIAAILKERNSDLCFTTSVPPDLEAVVASSLVRASSKPIK
jgi:asparagine synthetase B (glutamine-hydrolysing)